MARQRSASRRWMLSSLAVTGCVLSAVGAATAAPGVQEFKLPEGAKPQNMTRGPDGAVWYVETGGKIGRIASDGTVTRFPGPGTFTASSPAYITAHSDGNLYFTVYTGQLGRITPAGEISYIPIPPNPAAPQTNYRGIASVAGLLWVVDQGGDDDGDRIVSVNPASGATAQYPLEDAAANPEAVTLGPDGNVWFTRSGGQPALGRIVPGVTPPGTAPEAIFLPGNDTHANPYGLATGLDGGGWVTEPKGNAIGRILPDLSPPLRFDLAFPDSEPLGITASVDGTTMWFTEATGGRIGNLSIVGALLGQPGAITEYPVLTPNSRPTGIAAHADGSIWFTEFASPAGDRLGRVGEGTLAPPPIPGDPVTPGGEEPGGGEEPSGPDTTAPDVSVTVPVGAGRKSRKSGRIGVRVVCYEACTITSELVLRPGRTRRGQRPKFVRVGLGYGTLGGEGTAPVAVELNAAGKARQRKARRVRVLLRTTVADGAGNITRVVSPLAM